MLEAKPIAIGEQRFLYRIDEGRSSVRFWRESSNFDGPFANTRSIARAAGKIRKETGVDRVVFSSAPAPEQFDNTADAERIECFNRRVVAALTALGASKYEAEEIFAYVGMPSEWRGAMWSAAALAERFPDRSEAHVNLKHRIVTVSRFMPMAMTADGSFSWCLAVGNRVLEDALREFA